jgi:hypothetical protein
MGADHITKDMTMQEILASMDSPPRRPPKPAWADHQITSLRRGARRRAYADLSGDANK